MRANPWRYSTGVSPVSSLNMRRRLASLLKPSSALMVATGAEVRVKRSPT